MEKDIFFGRKKEDQKNKESYDLIITHYSKKGHGLASITREKERVPIKVEVVSSVVGDRLNVSLGKRKKGTYSASLLEILTPSKERVEPRCEHAGTCGGCSWQQLSYKAQLRQKEKSIASLFAPFKADRVRPIIPCNPIWQYRNKMEFSFSQNLAKDKFLGLIIARSQGKVLNLNECHLTSPWFTEILTAVRSWWERVDLAAYHPPSGKGTLRTLTLREGKKSQNKMILLTVSGDHDHFLNRAQLTSFKEAVLNALPKEENPSIFLSIHRAEKGQISTSYEMHLHGPTTLLETLEIQNRPFHFHISPASFFQPNAFQAETLFETALALAKPRPHMRIYDLYAGCGTLGMIFAPFVKKVMGIELCPYAVCDAQTNIKANHLTNCTMIRGDIGELLPEFELKPDLAIVDPPRPGLTPSAIKNLIRLNPHAILYISCNPATQAGNISTLTQNGYHLLDIQPIDQFPHTPHIENICYLEKNNSLRYNEKDTRNFF